MKSLKIFFILFVLTVISQNARSQSPIDTTWSGYIDIMGSKIGIITYFRSEGGLVRGTIDIPEQNAIGLPLTGIVFNNPKVHFELEAGPGLAQFDGVYYIDSITGSFLQAGIKGTFKVIKGEPVNEETADEDLPYAQEEVSFTNGENTFAGTFSYPKENRSGVPGFPAVILITGSGAQNRDEDVAGFKIFKTIADHLTRNGIAVLRYDDRGIGGTTGKTISESTTMDFADDVSAAVNYLKSRGDVHSIGLLGHSEGGIVAPITAVNSPDVQFIILVAGTGVKGIDILKEQSKLIMKANNSTQQEIDGYVKLLDAIYDAVKKNQSLEGIKKELKNSIIDNFEDMPKEERKNIKDPEKYAGEVAEMTIAQFDSKWMKYFMMYDPEPMLEKVSCPVLMLFGGRDLQVPVDLNKQVMLDALKKGGNQEVSLIVYPTANHLFQDAVTGSPSEYGQLKKEFVPGFLDDITEWIKVKVQ